jgi:hypothetical protein
MSGNQYLNTDGTTRKRTAVLQGGIFADYSPLAEVEPLIDSLNLKGGMNRPKGELLDRRHAEGDVLMTLLRTSAFNPNVGSKPVGFTTAAGLPYGIEEYAVPIGIVETSYIPGNTPPDKLQSVAIRGVVSIRLNAQNKQVPLSVDHGTTLIARFATLADDRDSRYQIHDERPQNTGWKSRDHLPMILPISAYNGQSIDVEELFNRAANTLLKSMKNQYGSMQRSKMQLIAEDSRDASGVWDEIDEGVVELFRSSLINAGDLTGDMTNLLIPVGTEKRQHADTSSGSGKLSVRQIFNLQMHNMLASVKTVDDAIVAQQKILQLTTVLNWQIMNETENSRFGSNFLGSTELLVESMRNTMFLGKQGSEWRCRNIIGMSMEHGVFRDQVDMFVQPATHRA